jgi:predicted outer membrane repeat protein
MKNKNKTNQFVRKKLIIILLVTFLFSLAGSRTSVSAANTYNFLVNSNEWWQDSNPNDGVCQEGNNKTCTFLAAMQEASTKNVGDIVNITFENGLVYPIQGYLPEISFATVNIYGNQGTINVSGHTGYVLSFHGQSKLNIDSLTIKNGSRNPLSIGSDVQVTINQCTFIDNTYLGAGANGAAIRNQGELIILNTAFTNNQAQHGGAIYNTGSLEVINTIFTNNSAVGYGGAISSIEGRVMISNSTFKSNQAGELGGAIHQSKNKIKINHTTFENNVVSGDGGAVSIFFNGPSQTHEIITSTFTSNQAINKGGAIYSYQSSLDFSYNSYQGNTAKNGGALNIYNNGISSFDKESFIQNTSQEQGGAIFLENNWVGITISKSDFYGNAAHSGGGVSVKDSKVAFDSSIFRENLSRGTETSHGGGGALIKNNSTNRQVDFNNTTFSGNIANSHGGGLFITDKGIVYLNNTTITQNISNQNQSKIGVGGGLLVDNTLGVVVNIQNSILAKNTHRAPSPAPIIFLYHHDWQGTLISKGYNILGSKGYNSLITGSEEGNYVGTVNHPIDPLLNSLHPFEYFGEILTYAHFPQNQSLAINRGNPAGCKNSFNINFLYDQRGREGWPRILQTRCDIGAIETTYQPYPALHQLILSTNSVIGGASLTGTLLLDINAPQSGIEVNISSNKSFATLPATTITIPAGKMSQTFSIQTASVSPGDYAIITAHLNGITRTSNLYVTDQFEVFLPLLVR